MRLLIAPLALLLAGCGPISFATTMKGEAVIQGSALGSLLNAFPTLSGFSNINFDENQDFKNNDARRENVKSVKLNAFTLKIVSPNTQDFGFLDTLEFWVKSGDTEEKIAGKANIGALNLAAPNPTLTLDLPDVELAPYVKAPSMTIITRGSGRQPSQETRLEASARFIVGVGL
ncbi:MAG TPA: hypothetical protein VGD87_02870 [Archangium sp.]